MKEQREHDREAAINARKSATERAKNGPRRIENSQFRQAVMRGLERYRKLFDSDAAMAKSIGASQATVNKILSGKQDPRLELVGKAMDALYAMLQYPWEPKNDTKKVALTGGGNENTPRLRVVMRHDIVDGAVSQTDDIIIAQPEEALKKLSETLSLGGFVISESMRTPDGYPGGSVVVVDFASKPEEDMDGAQYLVKVKGGSACIASAWEGRYVIDLARKDVLTQGEDYDDFMDAAIGKVVLHIRPVC